jgi:predicted O-methyltransferase YrrM
LRAGKAVAIALASAMVVAASGGVSAHRSDEYLQAARVDLVRDAVLIELDLTPGIAVAEPIIAMIDRDGDGAFSREEQHRYAGQVASALELNVDDRPLTLRVLSSTFAGLRELRRGEGTIELQLRAAHDGLSIGNHRVVFRNAHLGDRSVYLANALIPADGRVSVSRQQRDAIQRELTIDYAVGIGPAAVKAGWMFVGLMLAAVLSVRARRLGAGVVAAAALFTSVVGQDRTTQLDKTVQAVLDQRRGTWHDLNVPESDGRVLHDLIVKRKFTRGLEIGTSTGHSGLWIGWALAKNGGKLTTVEIDPGRHRTAVANFKEAGLAPYIDARLGDAHQIVPALAGPFDFVFSDADKEWYKNYFVAVWPKVVSGGCFTAHNVSGRGIGGGIREFLAHLETLPDGTTRIDTSSGAGISITCKR